MTNLLRNGSFEEGWTTPKPHHQIPDVWALDFTDGEEAGYSPEARDAKGEVIQQEKQWHTVEPELRVLPRHHLPEHEQHLYILDGDACLKVFKGQGAIHVWLSQRVEGLDPGVCYELTVPTFVDTYVWDGGKRPPQANAAPKDRAARIRLTVSDGDMTAHSRWFDEANVPRFYLTGHSFAFHFTATSDTMQIGFELWNPWPVDNNGWFFDALTLAPAEETPDPPEPPQGDCVPPRLQYHRTYVLLPQMNPLEAADWRMGAAIGGAATLRTLGHSADDAGVGPQDRTILAVNPGAWFTDLKAWFDEHYFGATYIPIKSSSPYDLGVQVMPPLGSQDIAQGQSWEYWRDERFGEDLQARIGDYGCFLTGLSIVLRKVYQSDVTPPLLDRLLVAARVAYWNDNLLDWLEACKLFGAFQTAVKSDEQRTASELADLLAFGWEIILRRADGEHFVYLESVQGETLHIIDTWDGVRKEKRAEDYRGIRAAKVRDGVSPPTPPTPPTPPEPPEPPEPPPTGGPMGPTTSFHAQAGADGQMEYIHRVKPSVFKLVQQSGMARQVHEASPETLIIYRKVWDNWHELIYGYGNTSVAVARFLDWIWPELEELERALGGATYVVEGLNETIACGAVEDIRRVVAFEVEFARQLTQNTPFNAIPCLLNTAVGNPEHGAEEEMLLPVARAAVETGGFLGYHNYFPIIGERSWLESDWEHYAGRWTAWDAVFRRHGVKPRYLLTESGPIGGTDAGYPVLTGDAGWRSPRCVNGDWSRTLDAILRCDQLSWQSVPGQEGRYWGQCLFTTGNVGWRYFQYRKEQFESLAEATMD